MLNYSDDYIISQVLAGADDVSLGYSRLPVIAEYYESYTFRDACTEVRKRPMQIASNVSIFSHILILH